VFINSSNIFLEISTLVKRQVLSVNESTLRLERLLPVLPEIQYLVLYVLVLLKDFLVLVLQVVVTVQDLRLLILHQL
jgi:hypothetical protein